MYQASTPSRRSTSRVEVSEGVWVYWRCDGHEYVSRVRNLSLGGLFVETSGIRPVGIRANLDFLVQEGPIRADALVRHATTSGLGLKFLVVREADRPRLASLVMRLRTLSRSNCRLQFERLRAAPPASATASASDCVSIRIAVYFIVNYSR